MELSKVIFDLADKDNYTIRQVVTILKLAGIMDNNYNLTMKYIDANLVEVWENIRDKKLLLELSKVRTRRHRKK